MHLVKLTDQKPGDPLWIVRDRTGWPVALFWREDIARQFLNANASADVSGQFVCCLSGDTTHPVVNHQTPPDAISAAPNPETVAGMVGLVTTDGRSPDEADITLATGTAPQPGDPWLTTRREHWPADLWPPLPDDRITVTVPRVIAASRPGVPT